ncbi:hypothetical protein [Streptosporangium sp. V21-05]|uniref:hypothetical protein n=1 Tax=Streptosporangium sp. V21-05 TaxID=3446115 RepID=UPI003F52C3DB
MSTDLAADLSPVQRAEALGHTAKNDPPHALSAVSRWTCTRCGAAVLSRAGVVYGSAIEQTCEQYAADMSLLTP